MQRALFILCIVTFVNTSYAQKSGIVFHHLKEKDGLSHKFVYSFLKDSRGIFWLSTPNGLNRFDGAHSYTYKIGREPNTMIDAALDLCEDKRGRIWGATANGIFCFTVETNRFKNYKTPGTRYAKVIQNIVCDRQGEIWATGEWNIMKYNPITDAFADIPPMTACKDSLWLYSVKKNGLCEDPQKKGMWIATNGGLHFYNTATNGYVSYRNKPHDSLFNQHKCSALTTSSTGNLWFFDNTTNEVVSFNPVTRKVIQRISMRAAFAAPRGMMLFEDSGQRLWLSTRDHGIAIIDLGHDNQLSSVTHDDGDALSIAGNFMYEAYEDADGTIWCGTVGGLSICNPAKTIYKTHRFFDLDTSLRKERVDVIAENPMDKTWWMGFSNNTVGHYFPATKKFELVDLNKLTPDPKGRHAFAMRKFYFQQDTIFLVTTNGIWYCSSAQKKIIPFIPYQGYADSVISLDLLRFNDSITYFNQVHAIIKFNARNHTKRIIKPSPDTLSNGQYPVFDHVTKGPDGTIWFVAAFGFIGYLDAQDHVHYIRLEYDSVWDYYGYYTSLHIAPNGTLWLANRGAGIASYDPASKKKANYHQSDGLVSNDMHTATPDLNGRIWCASFNSFSIFDPNGRRSINFSLEVSESDLGYSNYSSRMTNGHILTAVNQTVIEFLPDRLNYQPVHPKPFISMLSINGLDSLLPLNLHNDMLLESNERSLTFRFGMLTDKVIFPYYFAYQLVGLDDTFRIATASAEAVYNNLPSGKYTFKIIAISSNNGWHSEEVSLDLTIKTPFYKSIGFLVFITIISIGSFIVFYRYRIRQKEQMLLLEGKTQLLEKEKALVMYENLKQHLNPHFLFNSLTSLSSLIRIDQKMAGNFLDTMSKVYRYILRNRDNETVALREELNFVALYNQLQKTRFEDSLQIDIRIDEEYHHRKIAPVTLQNLVENAIKHNITDHDSPLIIELFIDHDYLIVRNNLQKKNFVETSNRQGLANMQSLYHYLSDRPMEIIESELFFTVKIPLL